MRLCLLLLLVGCEIGPSSMDGSPDAGAADAENDHDGSAADAHLDTEVGPSGPAVAHFTLPREPDDAFWELPWPNDIRRRDSRINVMDFPNGAGTPVLESYKQVISERVDGFSLSAPIYFTFSEAVDEAFAVDGGASLEPTAVAYLLDVDDDSPTRGQRHPAELHYWDARTRYWPGHTLAIRPVHGIPLRSRTTYAAIVTRSVRTATGDTFLRSEDFSAVVSTDATTDPTVRQARETFAEALAAVDDASIDRDSILSMAVFTTQDAVGELLAMRDWTAQQPAPPAVDGAWRLLSSNSRRDLVEGAFVSPQFQAGAVPFLEEGGDIVFNEMGEPIQQGTFDARFAIAVPTTTMPANGFPLVLYAHGTGGDYMSFTGAITDLLTDAGYAVMGIDAIHHGTRNPTTTGPEILTFNFLNPDAFRDNARQSAIDVVAQARFAAATQIPQTVLDRPTAVTFDASQMLFFGHSQGGINGALFMAIDDSVIGGILSGAGGHLPIAMVEKTEPLSIPDLVGLYLRVPSLQSEHLVYEHPVLALLQTWTEVADPINYAHMIFDAPRESFAAKSLLQTEGTMDAFTPPRSIESLALAARAPLVGQELERIEAYALLELPFSAGERVQGNVAGGEATAGLMQFTGGHFVAFDAGNRATMVEFLTGFTSGPPAIP